MRRQKEPAGGFSLIEVLIVVAIISMVTFLTLPSITSYLQISLHTAAREMASVIKDAYNSTIMTGRVHRIVYDLKENSYWVEAGPTSVLLDTQESREKEERRKRFRKSSEPEKPPSEFMLQTLVTRKKKPLPRGVIFEDIVTQQSPEPLVEGAAYTHLFPHGLAEKTIVHLKDNSDHHASLVISPLVGKTDVYERYLSSDELAKIENLR
ncbi:MAG: hypothetical protein A2070_01755 [Bdellovibrionales bacterium GWC1_52_8]|nr:MAG: hypothetical protein A2Z97_13525 [Bdellovibrionales bacterium GWB1_52_6]OFZ06079.1 MAG: hypothetical protein A2X97_01960 [Bdellovibrionales bacterium GWA1_52_35]OFZ34168.1 MAG: hypothetical protein A2070_01755 [Bdellovibrionales bacterium GWC1_52_8]